MPWLTAASPELRIARSATPDASRPRKAVASSGNDMVVRTVLAPSGRKAAWPTSSSSAPGADKAKGPRAPGGGGGRSLASAAIYEASSQCSAAPHTASRTYPFVLATRLEIGRAHV